MNDRLNAISDVSDVSGRLRSLAGKRRSGQKYRKKIAILTKYANAEDELTGNAYEVFRFRKVGNRQGELWVERDKARKRDDLLRALLLKNADLPTAEEEARTTVETAIDAKPEVSLLYASHVGWHKSGASFVTPTDVIGAERRRRLVPPLSSSGQTSVPLRSRGHLADWQASVALPALYSVLATFAVAAAFAAPLLWVTGRQPFGANLFGPSKIGKTTALLAGASVIGIGRESDLPNWSETTGGLFEQARHLNDFLMPINEVGLLPGGRQNVYDVVRPAIYGLSEGRERRRNSKSAYAGRAASEGSRTMFLSTSEYSFDEYAQIAGKSRDEGEYARCLDVPAVGKRGTIVSFFPKKIPRPLRQRWARRLLKRLRKACEKQHGTAFGPYVRHLVDHRNGLLPRVETYCKVFMNSIMARKLEGAFEHAAENFALIYAGGRLAIDSGVLPWPERKLRRAIRQCLFLGLESVPKKQTAKASVQKILEDALANSDIVERISTATFGKDDHAGFWERDGSRRVYTIHAKAFRSWFGGHDDLNASALAWLKGQGRLRPRKGKGSAASPGWAEQTPKWPNGKSVRSIVFVDPFAPIGG